MSTIDQSALNSTTKNNTVQESGLFSGQTVQVEVKGEDGSWPRASTSAAAR